MQQYSNRLRLQRKRIGFVPTMGFLHEGHLSLVRRSLKENDITVASIFVNPAQFGPGEDFKKYPRDFKRDEAMLRRAGVDAVFYPTPASMYPQPYRTYVDVEGLTRGLCGRSRPGHFKGVATVVTKLLNIVKPDNVYVGQKDGQQAAVLKKMARDLNMDLNVKALPTVREPDGLAMSSRNSYLNPKERKEAALLYKSLQLARRLLKAGAGDPSAVISKMKRVIRESGLSTKVDYIEIVNGRTMEPVKTISGDILIALAARVGKTRLIDNIRIKV
jgi:pantoate--beta-alanine ligase